MRRLRGSGHTVLELLVVLTLMSIVLAIAIPRGRAMVDGVAVRAAAADVLATLDLARTLAIAANGAVAVEVDSATGTLRVRRGDQVVLTREVGSAHGVRLRPTRDSMSYNGRGLGRGAANLSIAIRRGALVETVFVSRLGRAR
jgi:Tfp pilus assembly protein FimT